MSELQFVSDEYNQRLKDLADKLVTPERYGKKPELEEEDKRILGQTALFEI